MSLGAAIGVGLFLGSASAIKLAGPAIIISYAIGGLMIYLIMRALGEMAIKIRSQALLAAMRANLSDLLPAISPVGTIGSFG